VTDSRERSRPLLERFERFLDAVIPPPDEIVEQVARGEALLRAGDTSGALRIASSVRTLAPGYLRGILLRADALAASGNVAEALATLDEVVAERSVPPAALGRMVEWSATVGDEPRALSLEGELRSRLRDPDPAIARRLLSGARALIARGSPANGLRLARAATLIDPQQGAAWLLLADDAIHRGEPGPARRALERAEPSLDPADAATARTAGEIALAIGDLDRAARYLRRAWIIGDEGAIAPLVLVFSRRGDQASLERVIASASGASAALARALNSLARQEPTARTALDATPAASIPDVLWRLALEIAIAQAPDLAARWAHESPERSGAAAVRAWAAGRDALASGDARAARAALASAFGDELTDHAAREVYRAACKASWAGQLGDLLDELAALVRETPTLAALEAELRTRRRELDDPLRVAILGEFSAGKSTFLNALVGATVSPMGVLPTTAHVHWLRSGEPGARVVDMHGGAVAATIDEAPRIVERKRAAGQTIDYVEVTLPIARLSNVDLIDTPGFNAGEPAHEVAVRRAFDIADVAIWLFDARQAGKLSETGPLREARDARLPVFGVLNKIDQVPDGERGKVLDLLRSGFADLAPVVQAVSARDALQSSLALASAAVADDVRAAAQRKLAASGWPELLATIDAQLILQRAAWKRVRIARRARDIVARAEQALARDAATRATAAERVDALGARLSALRDGLREQASAIRREVGAVLREQLQGLSRAPARDRAADSLALANDAAAEVAHRARARALERLRPALREIETLAVEAGVVAADAAALVTAPVQAVLDVACVEGVRDASSERTDAPSFAASDPLAVIEELLARRDAVVELLDPRVAIALAVARGELDEYEHRVPAVRSARVPDSASS